VGGEDLELLLDGEGASGWSGWRVGVVRHITMSVPVRHGDDEFEDIESWYLDSGHDNARM
jgi:hypothetical protein